VTTEQQFDRLEQALRRLEKGDAVSQGYISIKQTAAYTPLSQDYVRRSLRGETLSRANLGTSAQATHQVGTTIPREWMWEREARPKQPPGGKKTGATRRALGR
jgi:hypothetical protein